MYKITFVKLLFGFIPFKKSYEIVSHAIIFDGVFYEIILKDKTNILIPTTKWDIVVLDKEFQKIAASKFVNLDE